MIAPGRFAQVFYTHMLDMLRVFLNRSLELSKLLDINQCIPTRYTYILHELAVVPYQHYCYLRLVKCIV